MSTNEYTPRYYRDLHRADRLETFQVVVKETDLLIHAGRRLEKAARDLVLEHRHYIEAYLQDHPSFLTTLTPWTVNDPAPPVVRQMIEAGTLAGVGPMAAVAGAIAEQVGRGLVEMTEEVIVENGGDVFVHTASEAVIAIFAGKSPLSLRIGVRTGGEHSPAAVCTSSGTLGHSLSLGKADAVCAVASSCALADAAATSVGNRVRGVSDIAEALEVGKQIAGIKGFVVICGDRCGMWGDIEVVPLSLPDKHQNRRGARRKGRRA